MKGLLSRTEEYSAHGHLLASDSSPLFKAFTAFEKTLFPTTAQSEGVGGGASILTLNPQKGFLFKNNILAS